MECSDCKSEVPKGAKKCKHCGKDLRNWLNRHPIISLFLFLMIFGMVSNYLGLSEPTNSSSSPSPTAEFSAKAKERFKGLESDYKKAAPGELDSIECFDDCTSVVYFNFKKVPSDLETVVRGQAATFSKFKLDNTGTSHITVFASLGNNTIFKCTGSSGMVDECN